MYIYISDHGFCDSLHSQGQVKCFKTEKVVPPLSGQMLKHFQITTSSPTFLMDTREESEYSLNSGILGTPAWYYGTL